MPAVTSVAAAAGPTTAAGRRTTAASTPTTTPATTTAAAPTAPTAATTAAGRPANGPTTAAGRRTTASADPTTAAARTAAALPAARRGPFASERRMAELGALIVMVVWAANFIVVKDALNELPPIGFTTTRFILATVVLFIVLRLREGSVAIPRRDVLPLLALGAVGFGIYQTIWTVALGQTTAGDSSLLIAGTPIFTLLIAGAIGSDHLTRSRLVGALVSFLGVGLVVVSAGFTGFEGHLFGNVVTVIAAVLWSIYVAVGAPVLRRHSPLRMTTWAVFFGTLVMLPLGLWQLSSTDFTRLTIATPLAVFYAGVLSIALGNVVQFRAVQLIGPARASAFQFLVPAITVVLAAILLNERIRIEQIIGGIVIVLGIVIARRSTPPAAAPVAVGG